MVMRKAGVGQLTSSAIVSELQLPIKARRVRQYLQQSENLAYLKRIKIPLLTEKHRIDRVEWASPRIQWQDSQSTRVIFSDETKYNLDGPDGFQYYWPDLGQEREIFSKRQQGGGSVMVWGAIMVGGRSELAILEGRQNSERYMQTLETFLLPMM
ncbi:TPA: hypothetical protein N0F65_009242 [Lagenidium giganteum]|uniref:Transposase n=1 Tax=Lagenidium giganteum TaxID=4803 RepID=A0AAV2YHU7_9STRA|nr:TPA: hypothetical protein N0F65_009242 [Lagenidium giganteum]